MTQTTLPPGWFGEDYPLTPEEAATKILAALLADLPEDRQQDVRNAIEEWGSAREEAVLSTEMEASR